MKRSAHEQLIRALAFIFVAMPFAFASVRAIQTGNDLRYFWVAGASLFGALAVMTLGKASTRPTPLAVALPASSFTHSPVSRCVTRS